MTQRNETNSAYVRDLVRRGDRDRYWSALLAPAGAQRGLLALYAFNIELARISEQVKEPQLGEIRLQWWRDALGSALRGEPADHPVLSELAATSWAEGEAPTLMAMIDTRAVELYEEPIPDFAALERYLTGTAGAVFRLAALSLDADNPSEPSAQAALAYGLTGLMRAIPFHAAQGRLYLPASLLGAHGVHPDVILRGAVNQDVRAALRDMRQRAEAALSAFRRQAETMPRAALPAYLPLASVEAYLGKLSRPDHDPLRNVAELNPLMRYGRIWRAYLRGAV